MWMECCTDSERRCLNEILNWQVLESQKQTSLYMTYDSITFIV